LRWRLHISDKVKEGLYSSTGKWRVGFEFNNLKSKAFLDKQLCSIVPCIALGLPHA
jgi:hypothetical protein